MFRCFSITAKHITIVDTHTRGGRTDLYTQHLIFFSNLLSFVYSINKSHAITRSKHEIQMLHQRQNWQSHFSLWREENAQFRARADQVTPSHQLNAFITVNIGHESIQANTVNTANTVCLP